MKFLQFIDSDGYAHWINPEQVSKLTMPDEHDQELTTIWIGVEPINVPKRLATVKNRLEGKED
jgi:hypothetical protein